MFDWSRLSLVTAGRHLEVKVPAGPCASDVRGFLTYYSLCRGLDPCLRFDGPTSGPSHSTLSPRGCSFPRKRWLFIPTPFLASMPSSTPTPPGRTRRLWVPGELAPVGFFCLFVLSAHTPHINAYAHWEGR
uniref:Uncharacterized protein n=1 Tax=Myotis myotis TaxID=51298 RepID=A0A7J8AMA6_MYOMY|nr:hypothetical protein mMyoMyo1_008166 [Myotis myotis]